MEETQVSQSVIKTVKYYGTRTAHIRKGTKARKQLSDEQVRNLRKRYNKGDMSCKSLGKMYGIGPSSVARIVNRQAHKNVQDTEEEQRKYNAKK